MTNKTIHIIGGPTASGKSAHAIALAEKLDGVIINADSMQIYDGLPTLTAQPSEQDKTICPHLLYGALHPNEACSAGNWREMVEPLIVKTLEKEKTPIIVGGSGLYIHALTDGLSPIPDIPNNIREKTNARQQELGNPAFFEELKQRDPIMASRLHEDHTARLIRAWEVIEFTGKSLAEWQEIPRLSPPDDWQLDVTLVMPKRETLYERCNQRFITMLNGALEEVKAFNKAKENGDITENSLLNNALGAKPLTAYLNGKIDKESAIDQGQRDTRHYAKRQVTWFRHQIKPNKNVAKISVVS